MVLIYYSKITSKEMKRYRKQMKFNNNAKERILTEINHLLLGNEKESQFTGANKINV